MIIGIHLSSNRSAIYFKPLFYDTCYTYDIVIDRHINSYLLPRLLFWGLHLREQGDRLDRIELLLNGGSLQTGGRAELRSRQGRPPTRDRRPPTGGRPKTAPSGAHVTALAGVRGPISLPGKTLVAVPKAPVAQEAAAPPATPATRRRRVQMQSGPGSESEGEVENLAAARMRLRPPTRAGPAPPDAEADGRRFLYLGDADGKVVYNHVYIYIY